MEKQGPVFFTIRLESGDSQGLRKFMFTRVYYPVWVFSEEHVKYNMHCLVCSNGSVILDMQ